MSHSRPFADWRSAWIISPAWDLACLVATPLAIVPALWAAAALVTPERIDLFVAAFASFAHHLPGFMRCYGDRELFLRYRWRFLLAPPLLLGISWSFALLGLHGLTLVLLVWGTWHGLMQTYGFMRIYDLKRGVRDPLDGRHDFALALVIFTAGMVFSDARAYGVAAALWECGLPVLDPVWLAAARWVVGGATVLTLLVYAVHSFRRARSPIGLSWTKIALALTTAWLFWTAGTVTTNLLVGVAMFEIFHAVQYYAIVWSYNRRLAERAGQAFGPLGFLFHDRWLLLGLYLAAIFAYGSIRFFGAQLGDPLPQKLLIGVIGASSLLHFYFDGFIWKVRERKTQLNLNIDGGPNSANAQQVSGRQHAARWALLIGLMLGLLGLEQWQRSRGAIRDEQLAFHLAAWTPALPEAQTLLSQSALQRGDTATAIALARDAIRLRQRSYKAHATLGVALLADGQLEQAESALRQAVRLGPHVGACYEELARVLLARENYADAERVVRLGLAVTPRSALLQRTLGDVCLRAGSQAECLEPLRTAVTLDGSAESWMSLGVAHLLLQQYESAEAALIRARELAPQNADVQFQLGNLYHATDRIHSAIHRYERCVELRPDYAAAHGNLGVAYFELERWPEAAASYQRALELAPANGQTHYNLALCLLAMNNRESARSHLRQARELGKELPTELVQQLGLGTKLPPVLDAQKP